MIHHLMGGPFGSYPNLRLYIQGRCILMIIYRGIVMHSITMIGFYRILIDIFNLYFPIENITRASKNIK